MSPASECCKILFEHSVTFELDVGKQTVKIFLVSIGEQAKRMVFSVRLLDAPFLWKLNKRWPFQQRFWVNNKTENIWKQGKKQYDCVCLCTRVNVSSKY